MECKLIRSTGFRKWDIFVQTTHPKTDGHRATGGGSSPNEGSTGCFVSRPLPLSMGGAVGSKAVA